VSFVLEACDDLDGKGGAQPDQAALLIYCGITMVNPVKEIADRFKKTHNVNITISQGGSEDLYQSLSTSRLGDIYFPGSLSYRTRHLHEGLLGEAVHVGYNQAALIVPKGNPKRLPASLNVLTDPSLSVVIANPRSGSIGRETKRITDSLGLSEAVLNNTIFMATDSRNLTQALLDGSADVILNWRATAFFESNRNRLDVLDLDPAIATPKDLTMNLLTFSANRDIARAFMILAASPEGQAIFRQHGFVDNAGRGEKTR